MNDKVNSITFHKSEKNYILNGNDGHTYAIRTLTERQKNLLLWCGLPLFFSFTENLHSGVKQFSSRMNLAYCCVLVFIYTRQLAGHQLHSRQGQRTVCIEPGLCMHEAMDGIYALDKENIKHCFYLLFQNKIRYILEATKKSQRWYKQTSFWSLRLPFAQFSVLF